MSQTGRILCVPNTLASTTITIYDGLNETDRFSLLDMSTAVRKRASSWGAGGLSITGDGGAASSTGAFDGTMGSGASIEVGHTLSANQWNGTIRNVRIFPTQVSSSQLQAMTA
jgi:hypothetical protein